MFSFKTNIVHRRNLRWKPALLGLGFIVLFLAYAWAMFTSGSIGFIDRLMANMGLASYSFAIYSGITAILMVQALWAVYYLFRAKKIKRGFISFMDDKLIIRRGKEVYEIPQSDLTALTLEIRDLPAPGHKPLKALSGGSFLRIPSKDGEFVTEIDILEENEKRQLLQVADYLKIEHDVPVLVKKPGHH